MSKKDELLTNKEKDEILRKMAFDTIKDISSYIHKAIQEFYDNYSPEYYQRTFGLKNLFSPKIHIASNHNSVIILFTFSSDFITTEHEGSNKDVFYYNVIAGYHGAPTLGWANHVKNPYRDNPSPWRKIYQYIDKKYGVIRQRNKGKSRK